jgi:hypothetical protein
MIGNRHTIDSSNVNRIKYIMSQIICPYFYAACKLHTLYPYFKDYGNKYLTLILKDEIFVKLKTLSRLYLFM